MSRSTSTKKQPSGRGRGPTTLSGSGGSSAYTVSLLILLGVVAFVAISMVRALVAFVIAPDPGVKAGPMYVTLALTTGAALLMLFMALSESYLPIVPRGRERDVYLVMCAMGVTGAVTGVLTVGAAATPLVSRLVLGSIAFMFITLQHARRTRARAAAAAGGAAKPAARAQTTPRPPSRQRRGGRKR